MKVLCKHNVLKKKYLKSNIFNNNKCVGFLETVQFDVKGKLQRSFLPVVMYIQVKRLLERDFQNNHKYIKKDGPFFLEIKAGPGLKRSIAKCCSHFQRVTGCWKRGY